MPKAGGLPDVTQRIDLDSSGYVKGSDEIIIAAIKMAKENKTAIDDMISSQKEMMKINIDLKNSMAPLLAITRDVINIQKEMVRAVENAGDAHSSFAGVMRKNAEQANDLIDTYKNMGEEVRNVTAEQHAVAQSFLETLDPLDRLEAKYGTHATAIKSWNDMNDEQIDRLVKLRSEIVKTGETVAKTSIFAQPFQSVGGDRAAFTGENSIAAYAASLARARAVAADAETSIMAAQRGTSDYLAAAAKGKNRDGTSLINAALASAVAGGGGGSTAIMAARAAASAGDGGGAAGIFGTGAPGGGGGGGRGSSFVPWRGGGANAVRFWGMMTAEVAATVVPALTAAGSAALVGVQSIEAMVPRYKAIFATSESLGDAFNMTTGKFLGGGTALQKAQDAYQGAGYVMAGNLLSIIQGGGGKGFIDMGKQTLGMLSRGTSAMAVNFEQGGLGKRLSDALAGGPEYLRQFGDIGANIGNTLLNVAPNLPGVGQDLLSTLQGGTGLLATATRDIPGPLIGGLLSYEAASRWGPALLGGQGLIGRMLGLSKMGGLGGLISKGGIALGGMGAPGGALESLGLGISGAGEAAAGIAGWPAGLLGGTAYLMGQGFTAKNVPETRLANMQAQISGFTSAWEPLGKAVTTATGLAAHAGKYVGKAEALGITDVGYTDPRSGQRKAILPVHDAGIYAAGATGFAQQMGDLAASGPQLQAALKKAGLKGVGLADAFQIAENALLDTTHAFDKHGKLTATASQMVTAYAKVIAPMTQSPGAFGAAVGAQTIMSQGAMSNLAKVNQAMDSYQAIIAGGPLGASGLAAGASAAPAKAIAKGLTGYSSAASAKAWQAFTSTSSSAPGFITQMQQFGDQMRTYLTLGTADLSQTKGFSANELKRILPQAKQSPAALAMLMQQGAAMGVTGYYDTSKTQAQNYKDVANALKQTAYSSAQFKKNMDSTVIATANIPAVARQFADYTGTTVQAKRLAQVAKDAMAIQKTAAASAVSGKFGGGTFGGPIINQGAVKDLVVQLRAAGVQGGAAMKASLDAVLRQAGVGKAVRIKIEAQVTGLDQAQAKLAALKSKQVHAKVNVDGAAQLKTLESQISALKSKTVQAAAKAQGAAAVRALAAAIAALRNKEVTVTTRMITIGGMAGVTVGIPAGVRAPGLQTGGMVPGSGHGDIIPAMLEPGEAIIPRYLVPLIAPILAAHHVPGFGGIPQSSASHFAAGGIASIPPDIQWTLAHMMPRSPVSISGDLGKKFSYTLIDEITKALSGANAKKLATALVNKITQEIQYAKSVSGAMKSGLNLGGMDVTPGTGQGTVQEQMQSYLGSLKSFSTDLTALRKGHLNKNLIKQLVDAGPVQGDALAQSIIGGPGGIGAVNKLWSQIGGVSGKIGSQAAMAQYGGMLAPNLRSGTFVGSGGVNISINVNAGQGGTLSLSEGQIKALVAKVQAALLKQAKRNNKTGLQLGGKGA